MTCLSPSAFTELLETPLRGKLDPLTLRWGRERGERVKPSASRIIPLNLPRPFGVLRELSAQPGTWKESFDVATPALNSLAYLVSKYHVSVPIPTYPYHHHHHSAVQCFLRASLHVFQKLCSFFLSSPLFFLLQGVTSHCPSRAFILQEKHPRTSTV